jgi:hypothetical protein
MTIRNLFSFVVRFLNKNIFNSYIRLHFPTKTWNNLNQGNFKYLIRVDDFPDPDFDFNDFIRFHEIMKSFNCPYLLGVTPFSPKGVSENEIDFLKNSLSNNVSLSLHGFTHQKLGSKKYQGEVDCYSDNEIKQLIQSSKSFFANIGVEYPNSFIPAFNIIDKKSAASISNEFKYIMGGPVSLTTLGIYRFLEKISSSKFIPSFFPFYGKSSVIDKKIRRIHPQKNGVMVITLHWTWEVEDNFKSLKKFLEHTKDIIVDYETAQRYWNKL